MRIGIVGTENSHADHFVRHFNTEERYPGHRIAALAGGRSERNTELARAGDISQIVDGPGDLLGLVDAAIVCSRDGGRHRAEATTLLDASLPVLVDKPLACDVPDAQAILDTARQRGVPVTSYSALRFAAETTGFAGRLRGKPELVTVRGPADQGSQYGGIFFYGIHIVEIALALLPGQSLTDIRVATVADTVVVSALAGATRVLLEFVKPDGGTVPWRMVAQGPDYLVAEELRLGPEYTRPGADVFASMLDSGTAPLSDDELLEPVRVLSTVAGALA